MSAPDSSPEAVRSGPARLGIYVDTTYHIDIDDPGRVWADPADLAFLMFAREVGRTFRSTVLFGRTLAGAAPAGAASLTGIEVAALPYYRDLRQVGEVIRAVGGTIAAFWRGLSSVDLVWVFGPHPFGMLLVGTALLRGKRVALGVRQDTLRYYRSRLPRRTWAPVLVGAWTLDRLYRLLARRLPTTVVGAELASGYGSERSTVLPMTVSLVRAADVATAADDREWTETIQLLTVGRIEPEKNPLLLIDAIAELQRVRPNRFRLTWVGGGRLEEAVRRAARRAQVADRVDLVGFVPFGPDLLELYRRAHAFVHVSRTEGVPQVLTEALACGTPLVATAVGGVSAAVEHGAAALLVPPDDMEALVRAVIRLSEDADLRRQLITRGLELARRLTLEAEASRVASFLAA